MRNLLLIFLLAFLISCAHKDKRYQKDKHNHMTKRAKKASHYLVSESKRVIDINIKNKKANQKAAEKRRLEQEETLNKTNNNEGSTTKPGKAKPKPPAFNIY